MSDNAKLTKEVEELKKQIHDLRNILQKMMFDIDDIKTACKCNKE